MKTLLLVLSSLLLVAAAPGPDEIMDDPALEQRAMALYSQLRCVVCPCTNPSYLMDISTRRT